MELFFCGSGWIRVPQPVEVSSIRIDIDIRRSRGPGVWFLPTSKWQGLPDDILGPRVRVDGLQKGSSFDKQIFIGQCKKGV